MTVAGKVNTFVISIAMLTGVVLGASAIRVAYLDAKDALIERSYFRIQSRPDLHMAVYRRDAGQLQVLLRELLATSDALRFAYILEPNGDQLSYRRQVNSGAYEELGLATLRGEVSAADNSLTSRHTTTLPPSFAGVARLTGGDRLWDLTIPLLTPVNTVGRRLSDADFALALASPKDAGSQHVMGYVHFGISRLMLVISILPKIVLILLGTVLLVVVCGVLSFLATRRITAPFSSIVRMAEDVSAGRRVSTQGLEKNAEFKDLVALLNSIVGDFKHRATKMAVDQQLLSMKVEERTSQLSKRNEELNKAVKEVTETRDRLHKLAYFDSLTSLPNRRLFTEQLDMLLRLAKRKKETLGLLFLDLDNFKRINDSLGHSAGDFLLREVGRRLSRCIRDSDLVGYNVTPESTIDVSRLGGDEFTVVLNQLSSPEAVTVVARRLLEEIGKPMQIEGHELVVTPSIGIAIAPDDADTVEGLLKAADTAMYHAKATGKNNYLAYSPALDAADVARLELENDLRKAIDRNELVLYYQPQVDTMTGNVVGAEALMRWEHATQGLIPPFKFIPLAEETGLIGSIGEWALEQACLQLVELQAAGIDLPKVSVNVSALQFTPSFIRRVADVLQRTGIKPSRLELELTEGIMMNDSEEIIAAVKQLKRLGVQLSIDDFGTGYSSLSYLSRFPLDELKIDRSFVVGMENSDNDASLVIAIIAMARSMKLQLVAEGVENPDQYRFLRQHGASMIQGYMFSKPVPVEELKPLLSPGYFKEQIEGIDSPVRDRGKLETS